MSVDLVDTGVIRKLDVAPSFCCPAFLVSKSSGGFRLIVDLRAVNVLFAPVKVSLEALSWLAGTPKDVVRGASVDLASGYYHLRLHPAMQRLMCFELAGCYY